MKTALPLLVLLALAPPPAQADPALSAQAAVGRIGIGEKAARGTGGCSGVLVAPDVVLTATHCVTDHASGRAASPETVFFAPGTAPGRVGPVLSARRITLPARPGPVARDARFDVARIDLSAAIPAAVARPLPLALPDPAEDLATLGYPADPAQSLVVQGPCPVAVLAPPVLAVACRAQSGFSGGPVLRDGQTGAQVVAVMVARQTVSGAEMTLAVIPDPAIWPAETPDKP